MKKAISPCFESGAIVLHIAQRHAGLLPYDGANARRARSNWMFAALSQWIRRFVDRDIVEYMRATRPGTKNASAWSMIASACGLLSFPVGLATSTGSTDAFSAATF